MGSQMNQYVAGLKSRHEEVRSRAARELHHYVMTELREVSSEELANFMDKFNQHIFEMVSSSDVHEKKGGILAIVSLIDVDVGNTSTRYSRFANYLRNLLPGAGETGVMEMASSAVGKLALASGTYSSEYVEFESKRAFEWLTGDRSEMKRHAAVLVLRELAICTPTFFFQQIQQFFDCIFIALRDPKPIIREASVNALRAALVVTSQREIKEKERPLWYSQCFTEVDKSFDNSPATRDKKLTKDDWLHGSLLVANELLRCSNIEGEKIRMEMDEISLQQLEHDKQHREAHPTSKLKQQFGPTIQQLQQKAAFIASSSSSSAANHSTGHLSVNANIRTPQKLSFFESRTCKQLMRENFNKICMFVLNQRPNKNAMITQVLLNIMPRLAAFEPAVFIKNHLSETIKYILNCIKTDREKSTALQSLGLLAVSVHDDIMDDLPKIMETIQNALPYREAVVKKKYHPVDPAVFTCISMLAKAVGSSITDEIRSILESMFAAGLSPALTSALYDVATQIPALKENIQAGLLGMLSVVLMKRELSHPGAPKLTYVTGPYPEFVNVNNITLALKTLGSFDFEGHSLTAFVKYCAVNFLSSEYKDIRLQAVITCSRLLLPSLKILNDQSTTIRVTAKGTVAEVLKSLLDVGITDCDPDIRLCVMTSLDRRFDPHLAQADNLSALFIALSDEVFEIREVVLCTIGRLSSMNPSYIMPSLRKTLRQLLMELNHSGLGRNKEQAAIMIGHLVRSTSPRLIKPYIDPMLDVLVPKLEDPESNSAVIVAVLAAIGEQAQVSGLGMECRLDKLLPIILDMMQDSSSLQKREVALWTLGQLVEGTGCVVTPYEQYPALLEVLLNFLKTEQTVSIRREAIRVLGLMGALDPWKHKVHLGQVDKKGEAGAVLSQSDSKANTDSDYTMSEMLVNMSFASNMNEFYPAAAINSLMKVMKDPTLSQHHTNSVQAVSFIFKSLELKCVPYLSQVMPAYIHVIRTCEPTFREFLLQQLGSIITIVKQHIHNYLDDIFELINDYWTVNTSMQGTMILLLENMVVAIGTDFRIYLPQILPRILKVFIHDTSEKKAVTGRLLGALQQFGPNLDEHLHLILTPIVKLFDATDAPMPLRKRALETVTQFSFTLDLTEYVSKIFHPLLRVLDTCGELRPTAMDTLVALIDQMGDQFQVFTPAVNKVLMRHKINHQQYDTILARLSKSNGFGDDYFNEKRPFRRDVKKDKSSSTSSSSTDQSAQAGRGAKKLHLSSINLQKAWTVRRRVSKDDWVEWLRRFSIQLLKESPSHALRSCWGLAQNYNPLARDLFNAAFVSCWSELKEQQQDELVASLEEALTAQDIPEITQTILNLAEFLEHCDKGSIPLNKTILADRAIKRRAYAKALHYKEEDFQNKVNTEILESLISINNKLQQPEAATGVLEYAKKHHTEDLKVQEQWYEKLHEWDKALHAYEYKLNMNPQDINLALGKMRCLEALGEWDQLHDVAQEKWPTLTEYDQQEMSCMAAASAWGLKRWDSMEEYACMIPRDSYDGAFYRAVLALHMNQFHLAQQCIDKARDILDTELTVMAGESYQRAYGSMVNVQILAELEEVIQYKLIPERRPYIRDMWWTRLQGCERVMEDWQRVLQVHSLVLEPSEDHHAWLKYASLCRKNGRLSLSNKALITLLGCDPKENPHKQLPLADPQVTFAYMKHMWKSNEKEAAVMRLQMFVDESLSPVVKQIKMGDESVEKKAMVQLLAKCYLKLGSWQEDMLGVTEESIDRILINYKLAVDYNEYWYKAWHAFAYMNYETVLFYKSTEQPSESDEKSGTKTQLTPEILEKIYRHCVPAIKGFVKSISLSTDHSLQDILRLLHLWFHYGQAQTVNVALAEGIKAIAIDKWIQVIPQLIARIDTTRSNVKKLIHALLKDIGVKHPQALIYPLAVASKSSNKPRREAANVVLHDMQDHSDNLVRQAVLISDELIRVSIIWHELWHEGLEEASRLYFGENNTNGMFTTLEPLHAMMDRGPQTLKETSFQQAYGRDLVEANEWCHKYHRTGKVKDLTQAWDLYYHVFRRISKQLPQLTTLELQYVSPKLLLSPDLEIAVPGSYHPNKPVVRIQRIQSNLQVITSKQRPRKLSIYGSDGQEYQFLLKGHEDLRQDERVMQLFGLVNSLLAKNPQTLRRNLTIQRYSVIPLSTNSGLIGWVPECDTLHSLIRDYREKKKILLNIEHRLMLKMAPDYDHLPLLHKVEVFEHALDLTKGDDLAKILWIKSPSSEIWFDRRTNYTRSLAVMSMVGYVLGLGDRHPSNLMLDRLSGKIIHIDFGDCFEVAMTREKFPEKIPFRLTRMLINAMEVTGIDGNYRLTCKKVMEVLRDNKDSLMAVLEAFVYDPLLNWRLVEGAKDKRSKAMRIHMKPKKASLDKGDKEKEIETLIEVGSEPEAVTTTKAVSIIHRVRDKLTGRDFQKMDSQEGASVTHQVSQLIKQATAHENLCQCYIGWCPFW